VSTSHSEVGTIGSDLLASELPSEGRHEWFERFARKKSVPREALAKACGSEDRAEGELATMKWDGFFNPMGLRAVSALGVLFFSALNAGCGGGSGPSATSVPVSTPLPTPTPTVGSVALIESSLPFGSTVATASLPSGHSAPTLTFRYAVRMNDVQTGMLAQIWVRTATQRCMGTGAASLSFVAGEQKIFNSANVSYSGSVTSMCALPYTTTAVEITVAKDGTVLLSQEFPGVFNFR
jgi:hypothetical protein